MADREAYYFGCLGRMGHFLHVRAHASSLLWTAEIVGATGMPTEWAQMIDGGLLRNGRVPDIYSGAVKAVPARGAWVALVWWDNSVDGRPGSNSGFYVRGFEWPDRQAALDYAQLRWPEVTQRQRAPLRLMNP